MSPKDKILDKLAKLKAAAEGEAAIGNAEAAEAFAGMINTLLLRHDLSMADVPTSIGAPEEPIVEHLVDPSKHEIKFTRNRIAWQEALARVVADAHMCRFLVTSGTNYITLVGTREHVMVAEYAYVVLVRAADKMSWDARNEWWKSVHGGRHVKSGNFRAAWLLGFIERIGERFAEVRRTEVKAAANASTALMCINKALSRANSYVDDKYKRKAGAVHLQRGNWEGRKLGRAAADKMAIGQKGVDAGRQRAIGPK